MENIIEGSEKKSSGLIYKSTPKKKVELPKLPFEKFYVQEDEKDFDKCKFKTIAEVVRTREWKEIYSNYYDFSDLELSIQIKEPDEQINAYDAHRQTQEIIKCANSFSYFCTKYVKINHPIFGLINFVPYSYQKRVIDCYGKHRFNILSKFRQGGLTTVSVVWSLWRCLFKTGQRIMVVSKTDREAMAAGEVAKTAITHLPEWLKPEMGKSNEHEKQFDGTSSVLWFYTVEAARGKSISILIIDEAAFIPDMHKHWKALFPTLATGGACEVISTVNGLGNWYEEVYHETEEGKNKFFNIIELDYWEHPLYNDPKWMEETRVTLGEKGWLQEIERSFLGSGDTWIPAVTITALVEMTKNNIPYRMVFENWKNESAERRNEYDNGALWIWREPIDGHEYIIGVDVAEGVGETGDNSCFEILDSATLEQVAEFYSNTCPPHIFAQILNEIGYFYNTGLLVVENANQGAAVLNVLQHDLAYDNLYYEDNKQNSCGLKTNKSKRPLFLQTLQQRLLNATLKVNSYRLVYELNTFMFNSITKRPEAQRGKHDDAIFAMALALYVRDSQLRGVPVGAEMPDEMMQIFKSEIYETIKKEILSDSLEDFLNDGKEEPTLFSELEGAMPGIGHRFKRKNDTILKEFGW